jgi:hypothetical protein
MESDAARGALTFVSRLPHGLPFCFPASHRWGGDGGYGVKRLMHPRGRCARTLAGLLTFSRLPSPVNSCQVSRAYPTCTHLRHVTLATHIARVLPRCPRAVSASRRSKPYYYLPGLRPSSSLCFSGGLHTYIRPDRPAHSTSVTKLMSDIIASRADYSRFRILVVGRTNAGKTTLVKRICNSSENPQVLTARGATVFPGLLRIFGIA